ncbi:MAG: hypothetical protein ABIK31_05165 [candidate division WOR-3 bacterium]
MLKNIYFWCIILTILTIACDGPFQPFVASVGKELNPINAGDIYIYDVYSVNSSSYAGVSKVEWIYDEDTIIDGVVMYPQHRYAYNQSGGFVWYLQTYHAQDDFGFYNYQTYPHDEYPIPYLRYPIYVGRKWQLKRKNGFFLQSYNQVKGEVLSLEDVDSYQDCWKISLKLSNSDDETYPVWEIIQYYQKDLGMVKMEYTVGSTYVRLSLLEKRSSKD